MVIVLLIIETKDNNNIPAASFHAILALILGAMALFQFLQQRRQFSLRSLFVVTVLAALVCSASRYMGGAFVLEVVGLLGVLVALILTQDSIGTPLTSRCTSAGRIAFISPSSLIDQGSEPAIATWRGMQLLLEAGFQCQAFCATGRASREEVCFERMLAHANLPYDLRTTVVPHGQAKLIVTRVGGIPVTVFRNESSRLGPLPHELPGFLAACDQFLRQ